MARVVKQKPMTVWEQAYIPEVIRGLFTTFKHFLRGVFRYETLPTVPYPEIKPEIGHSYRSKHRLMKRPNGDPRCVACYMCASACPAKCIYIEAGEASDGRIEKVPVKFEIDHLLCVFCGLCVEACPVDAIRMDTKEASFVHDDRKKFLATMDDLLNWDPKDYPQSDVQSQVAPGGSKNKEALKNWGLRVY